MRLGPLVYLLPLYSPLRLIEEIAMLDHLSHGRLDVGIGRGGTLQDYQTFQSDRADARARVEEGRLGTERMGRAPAVKGSPDRRMSEATSVIFSVLFGPMAHPPAGRGVGGVYPTRTAVAMPPERPKPAAGRP
jgi:alkanesulfonate monooxygenase SsuD/methylene tetrahydromethanopterin reductase-like flavin-dependent oxidoreductase (luciferase family)